MQENKGEIKMNANINAICTVIGSAKKNQTKSNPKHHHPALSPPGSIPRNPIPGLFPTVTKRSL